MPAEDSINMQQNVSLPALNTFGIAAKARYFSSFSNVQDLEELIKARPAAALLILGGGSNILFTRDFDGLVLKNEIHGIEKIMEDETFVYVKAGAGENWHRFVLHCIGQEWAGLENLSLIPGNVGASPLQNIGAYGVEIKDVYHNLEAFDLDNKRMVSFTLEECGFGYRESVFKTKYRGRFVILTVTYRLRKTPLYNTSYGAISQELEKAGVTALSIKAISDAVIRIRSSKLPDPAVIGNAGSFFKNPQVSNEIFQAIKEKYPAMPAYPQADGSIKLAAGWLIEQCGWKGYRKGDAGVHVHQALVLVNYGHANGKEIYDLSTEVLQSVKDKFGVLLEREVNII